MCAFLANVGGFASLSMPGMCFNRTDSVSAWAIEVGDGKTSMGVVRSTEVAMDMVVVEW